jgi:dihydroneopterin triphosphate diphosphatase
MAQPGIPIKAFGVSVVVLRNAGAATETLILKRNSPILSGHWCQVAGSTEAGESGGQTALRELKEETGLVPDRLFSAGYCEQFYHSAVDAIEVAPAFVAFVPATAQVVINEEHSESTWVLISEVDHYLSTPNQCELFAYVRKYFVERDPTKWVVDLIRNP